MARLLLDTDALIDAVKGVARTVRFLRELSERGDDVFVSDVVICEFLSGLRPLDEARGMRLLSGVAYLPTSMPAAEQAGRWRYSFARQGVSLSSTDCLIAATARECGAALVTANLKDYPMVESGDLTVMPLPR